MSFSKLAKAIAVSGVLALAGCEDGDELNIEVNEQVAPEPPPDDGGSGGGGGGTDPDPGAGPNGLSDAELEALGFERVGDRDALNLAGNSFDNFDGSTRPLWRLPDVIDEDVILNKERIWTLDNGSTLPISVGTGNQTGLTQAELDALKAAKDAGDGPTLTIEAGTEIVGNSGDALVISRAALIDAQGTVDDPIIFHSDDTLDTDTAPNLDGRNEWGGLILQGFGRHNTCDNAAESTPCNVPGEGDAGDFGGFDNDDTTGTLSFVIVAEGGETVGAAGDDLNGIGFMGVGRNTVVDHIQVHNNDDDGIEMFGGAVNLRHVVLTNVRDDSIDWDEGWQGNLQFGIVDQGSLPADRGIEADNAGPASDSTPRSKPTLANITFVGGSDAGQVNLFRRGSGVFMHNSILISSSSPCLDVDLETAAEFQEILNNGEFVFNNVAFDCAQNVATDDEQAGVDLAQLVLDDPSSTIFTDVDAALDSNLASQASIATLSEPVDFTVNGFVNGSEYTPDLDFLEATSYLGAVQPGQAPIEFDGWIVPGSLGANFGTGDIVTTDAELQAAGFTEVGTKDALDGTTKPLWRFPNVVVGTIALDDSRIYTLDNGTTLPISVGTGNQTGLTQAELDALKATKDAGDGPVLTIEAGTEIVGNSGDALVITRAARIQAAGRPDNPIVFHSDDTLDLDTSPNLEGRNEWGGLIIQGFGRHNTCDNATESTPCNVPGEGDAGDFGGFDNDDSSGVLRFVVVAEGGETVGAAGDDLNGIGFMGVGRNTVADHIQVHNNDDDGIEMFGGAVNLKYVVLTNIRDDSIDWDEGWQGNLQFAIVDQGSLPADRGIEADNAGPSSDSTPRSKPTLSNITFIGGSDAGQVNLFRRGSGVFMHNSILISETSACLDVDLEGSAAEFQAILDDGEFILNNVLLDCSSDTQGDTDDPGGSELAELVLTHPNSTVITGVDASLDANLASTAAEAQLAAPVDFTGGGAVNGSEYTPDLQFLEPTDFLGAIEPGTDGADFREGWVVEGSLF